MALGIPKFPMYMTWSRRKWERNADKVLEGSGRLFMKSSAVVWGSCEKVRMKICLLEIKELNVHNDHYKSDIYKILLCLVSHCTITLQKTCSWLINNLGFWGARWIYKNLGRSKSHTQFVKFSRSTQHYSIGHDMPTVSHMQSQVTSFSVFPLGALVTRTHVL